MLLLALLWGLSIPVTKLGLHSMPPITFTALRFAFAVPVLFIFAIGRHRIAPSALPKVAALGLVGIGIGIGNAAQSFGVAAVSASVGTIVSATIPIFIVILAASALASRGGLFPWLLAAARRPGPHRGKRTVLQPIFGIAASAAMFGDRMGLLFAAGVALVLVGVGFTVIDRRQGPAR